MKIGLKLTRRIILQSKWYLQDDTHVSVVQQNELVTLSQHYFSTLSNVAADKSKLIKISQVTTGRSFPRHLNPRPNCCFITGNRKQKLRWLKGKSQFLYRTQGEWKVYFDLRRMLRATYDCLRKRARVKLIEEEISLTRHWLILKGKPVPYYAILRAVRVIK